MTDARAARARRNPGWTRRAGVRALVRATIALACAPLVSGSAAPGVRAAPVPHSLAFGGRVIPADGAPVLGVRVVATDARGSYEALVDPSGVFVGSFATDPAGPVTLRVFSDSADPRYHASSITLGAGSVAAPARVVLIPRRWTIHGGPFAGRSVPIDPARATARTGDEAGFWRVTRRARPVGRAVGWAADSFPVRVAFRRERGDPAFSASDSTRFWALASELELLLGASLFRPASFSEIDGGDDGILVTVDGRSSTAGRTFITYDASGRIYEALVTVSRRDYLGDPRVLMHELLHALGFGHTTAWPSVMGPSSGGIARPTAEDVAYAQLYYAIAAIQREREAPFAILETLSPGERAVVSR